MKKPKNLHLYIPSAEAADQLVSFASELKRTASETELIRWSLRIDRYDPGQAKPDASREGKP